MADDRATLLALAARVEAAAGADVQMDCDIAAAIGFEHWSPADWADAKATDAAEGLPPPMMLPPPPRYTTSLDAAAALVPEGFLWSVASYRGDDWKPGLFCADCAPDDPSAELLCETKAATPALALCAAALRARAEEAGDE